MLVNKIQIEIRLGSEVYLQVPFANADVRRYSICKVAKCNLFGTNYKLSVCFSSKGEMAKKASLQKIEIISLIGRKSAPCQDGVEEMN